jgi:hypothetical protein
MSEMSEKSEKKEKQKLKAIFTRGGNLSDGRRFEAGAEVPDEIKQKDLEALVEMDAVAVTGERE